MPPSKKAKKTAPVRSPTPAPVPPPPKQRQHMAEKLAGARAQRGTLESGAPRFVYEVKWKDFSAKHNSFEPPECLVGWESEMRVVDDKYSLMLQQGSINVKAAALAAPEAAAKAKALELQDRRDRLARAKRRRAARAGDDEEDEDEEDSEEEEEDAEMQGYDDEALQRELQLAEQLLAAQLPAAAGAHARAHARADADTEAPSEAEGAPAFAPGATPQVTKKRRAGRSRVWLAFDRDTNRCTLPHRTDRSRICGAPPKNGTGTSGHIGHLEEDHREIWRDIQTTGRKPATATIQDALAAKVDQSKPLLGDKECGELNSLVARWIAKCGRPQKIVEDAEMQHLLARILELCQARLRYELPSRNTVQRELSLLGDEGKRRARDFVFSLLASGVKISITGDLWSDGGMGLFGIYAHGITDNFNMGKMLIGLISCESEVRPRQRWQLNHSLSFLSLSLNHSLSFFISLLVAATYGHQH